MSSITETIYPSNHEQAFKAILKKFEGVTFNLLVKTKRLGEEEKTLKFCGRSFGGVVCIKQLQVSVQLKPGGSIAWDLRTEKVTLHTSGSVISICRFFDNRHYRKILTLTTDPI